ncbi:MAG: CvpA family protein [Thermoguttaceae bacterium]|nr:CvpA family protein [Thermoguttaceae bacterium]
MENISVFDLVVTVLLVTTTFWGGLRGVVSQISAIATWILSGLAAARYGSVVGEIVSIPEPWRAPVSALIVFCAAALALSVATRFVKRAVSLAGLKEFDRQTGALFGLFKGGAICVVLTFFCVLASEKTRDLVDESKTGPYLASVSLLLRGAFPESETMTRYETLVASMESSQAKSDAPSLKSEIAELETYLKENVFSDEAADVVEEAETGEDGAASSGWDRFLSDVRGWGDGLRGSANAAGNATDYRRNGENGGNGANRESEESGREFWRGSANEEPSDGSASAAVYDDRLEYAEYEKTNARDLWEDWEESVERVVRIGYGERRSDGVGSDYSDSDVASFDLTTFLTNLAGGARTTAESSGDDAYRRSETAERVAASGESLNEFLGVASSRSASERRSAAPPNFDSGARRTSDGSILGRPNSTSTSLIPPLPY